MISVTTLGALRCSVHPDRVLAVEAGPPTRLLLDGGLSLLVREDADEVERRLARARRAPGAPHGHR